MDNKHTETWFSRYTGQDMTVVRWGSYGRPVLVFPTAGGDAEEIERMLMIRVLTPLIEAGKIKVYSIDSVAARVWGDTEVDPIYKLKLQNGFHQFIREEVVPAIHADCKDPELGIAVAGASIGAFNALSVICRFPDVFAHAVCMSGSYDVSRFIKGVEQGGSQDFYFSSPLHFVPNLPDGPQLDALRGRFVQFCHGGGQWEDPEQDWTMAKLLGAKGVPNHVDPWGADFDHDWPTWRAMLPKYLGELTAADSGP